MKQNNFRLRLKGKVVKTFQTLLPNFIKRSNKKLHKSVHFALTKLSKMKPRVKIMPFILKQSK